MPAARGPLTTFLLRAGLLAAALAVIAGILGMHVIAGTHSPAAHGAPVVHVDGSGHSGHAGSGHSASSGAGTGLLPRPAAAPETLTGGSACSAAGTCHQMSAMDAACVLSPGNTSLSAPMPGTAPAALPALDGTAAVVINYAYSPDSPSPGDLCISRT